MRASGPCVCVCVCGGRCGASGGPTLSWASARTSSKSRPVSFIVVRMKLHVPFMMPAQRNAVNLQDARGSCSRPGMLVLC